MTLPGRLSIAEACHLILAQPAPVLFPDTCALLDVVRAPVRSNNYLIPLAEELAKLATRSPKALHVLICETVTVEWHDHFDETVQEVEAYLQQGRDLVASLREGCTLAGLPQRPRLPDTLKRLPARLGEIASRLFATSLVVSNDQACVSRAFERQVLHRPPGRQGRGMNDCAILEHVLCVCAELQAASFFLPRVFSSSNTNDYCESGRSLHPVLRPEFLAVGLEYVTDLRGAKYRLGL